MLVPISPLVPLHSHIADMRHTDHTDHRGSRGSCSLDQLLVGGLVARLCQEHDLGLASFNVLGHLVENQESEHQNL